MPFRNGRLTLNMNTPALKASEGHCRCCRKLQADSSRLLELESGLGITNPPSAAVELSRCLQAVDPTVACCELAQDSSLQPYSCAGRVKNYREIKVAQTVMVQVAGKCV